MDDEKQTQWRRQPGSVHHCGSAVRAYVAMGPTDPKLSPLQAATFDISAIFEASF